MKRELIGGDGEKRPKQHVWCHLGHSRYVVFFTLSYFLVLDNFQLLLNVLFHKVSDVKNGRARRHVLSPCWCVSFLLFFFTTYRHHRLEYMYGMGIVIEEATITTDGDPQCCICINTCPPLFHHTTTTMTRLPSSRRVPRPFIRRRRRPLTTAAKTAGL